MQCPVFCCTHSRCWLRPCPTPFATGRVSPMFDLGLPQTRLISYGEAAVCSRGVAEARAK